MIIFISLFLFIALLLYVLFGGADFGAGIIETFTQKRDQPTINEAIAPVWEANHVWLILVVVIFFTGFPEVYSTVSLYLHIPLIILLIGIVLRGSAFTFRHYDPYRDRSQQYYTVIFRFSSFLAPLFLGIIIGAMMLGRVDPQMQGFYLNFIAPWFNLFCFSMGIFTCCLFAFLAAVYLIGETPQGPKRITFINQARNANIATIVAGSLVFLTAHFDGFHLFSLFLSHWFSITALIIATVSLPFLWLSLLRQLVVLSRVIAVTQVTLILLAIYWVQSPVIVKLATGNDITLINSVAPVATQFQLMIALIVGSLIILPSLYFLFRTFKMGDL